MIQLFVGSLGQTRRLFTTFNQLAVNHPALANAHAHTHARARTPARTQKWVIGTPYRGDQCNTVREVHVTSTL